MPMHDGTDIKDIAIDAVEGGIASFAGIYAFDKFLASPLQNALKSTGKYALPAAGLVSDMVLAFIAGKVGGEGVISEGLRVAGYSMLGKSIATYIGDPTPVAVASSSSEGWGSLSSHPLSFGAEVRY
jgi:hypothetical protein